MNTRQMYLLWWTLFGNCVAGITVLSAAKTILFDIYATHYPALVTGSFAASFVMALSMSNMAGRLVYGPLSDKIGTRLQVAIFGLSVPLV